VGTIIWFFSNLVGEKGSRIQGFFRKALSAFLTFYRFSQSLYLMCPIHPFEKAQTPLSQNKARMTFFMLSTFCSYLILSADASLRVTRTLDSLPVGRSSKSED
jgi:hypothetical protein